MKFHLLGHGVSRISMTRMLDAPTYSMSFSLMLISSRFVGLSGGEIFHEMMLRQGVKHMCE